MEQPKTIKIDDIEYVRADAVEQSAPDCDEDGREYVIVRSRDQGVMAGWLVQANAGTRWVQLQGARQLWRWDSAFVLVDLAESGVRDASSCQFSEPMSQPMDIYGACGIYHCTAKAGASIRAVSPKR